MTKQFNITSIKSFSFLSRDFDSSSGVLSLRYALDDIHFEEKFIFPKPFQIVDKTAFEKAIAILHFIAGISYYKAACPAIIEDQTNSIDRELSVLLQELYLHGLGEFSYRNKISLQKKLNFPISLKEETRSVEIKELGLKDIAAVPLGGGKDSLVTLEAVRKMNINCICLILGQHSVLNNIAELSQTPTVQISRKIDPLLFELNKSGALNGHIPISAILAASFTVAALLYNFNAILISQEHSSNIENLEWNGQKINHQYSKSLDFEILLSEYIKKNIASDLNYFSALRPYSELAICELFSKLKKYHQNFSSCNKNFTVRQHSVNPNNSLWCGQCPKCCFVFLCLAPFLTLDELKQIFGENLLIKPENQGLFEELLGLQGFKPFECVGEVTEAKIALSLTASKTEWQNYLFIQELAARVAPLIDLSFNYKKINPNRIPEKYSFLTKLFDENI